MQYPFRDGFQIEQNRPDAKRVMEWLIGALILRLLMNLRDAFFE